MHAAGRPAFAEPPSAARSWAGLRTARSTTAAGAAAGDVALAAAANAKPLYNLQPTPIVDAEALAPLTAARGGASAAAEQGGVKSTLRVGSFFFLWYLFNIGYNIYNKKALNALPLPWTVGLIQLSLGLLYVFPLWILGLRKVRARKSRVTGRKKNESGGESSPLAHRHTLSGSTETPPTDP